MDPANTHGRTGKNFKYILIIIKRMALDLFGERKIPFMMVNSLTGIFMDRVD